MIDKNGREIRHGDLLRVFHYVDGATRKNVYMYKLVVKRGLYMEAIDVSEIATKGLAAYRCNLTEEYSPNCEIIDGPSDSDERGLRCWYERPGQKGVAK